jgi:hypothetical protein
MSHPSNTVKFFSGDLVSMIIEQPTMDSRTQTSCTRVAEHTNSSWLRYKKHTNSSWLRYKKHTNKTQEKYK